MHLETVAGSGLSVVFAIGFPCGSAAPGSALLLGCARAGGEAACRILNDLRLALGFGEPVWCEIDLVWLGVSGPGRVLGLNGCTVMVVTRDFSQLSLG